MKIIKPSATLMEHNVHPYEFIERVGRTCYKSEDAITEGSAQRFVGSLVKREHMAMLEHEHIYLITSWEFMSAFLRDMEYVNERLEFFKITHEKVNILSGSFRSFYDLFKKGYNFTTIKFLQGTLQIKYPLVFGQIADDFVFPSFPSNTGVVIAPTDREIFKELFADRLDILRRHLIHTFKFVCDRGVSHEFVRHRPASFAQESTRYCNYAKDKFGNEITVILPCFFDTGMGTASNSLVYDTWKTSCERDERAYFKLLEMGATPQEARTVLPNSLKTELIVTATESEWQHIVNLRLKGVTGAPHPQIREVMTMAMPDLIHETDYRVK